MKDRIATNTFQKSNLDESNCKPNKVWVDKGSEFDHRTMKLWSQDNDIEVHSTYNEGKSVVAERLMRTLKNKSFKCMTSVSKNLYVDKSYNIMNKYNNTNHSTIKMRPVDVKLNKYIDFNKENYEEDPKVEVGDHVRIMKHKNIFAIDYLQIGLKNFLWLKRLKILCHGNMLLVILSLKKLLERFMENNYKKHEFRVEKVIKRKGDKLYV